MADLAPLTYAKVVGRFLAIVGDTSSANHHTNPTFETDTSSWVATGAASISRVTTEFHSGVASLEVITTATVNDGTAAILSGLSLGTSQQAVGFWVKAPLGAAMQADIHLWNTTLTAFSPATRYFTGTGDWQWVDTPGVARADGAVQIVALVRTAVGAALTFYVDDALATEVGAEAVSMDGTVTIIPSVNDMVRVGGATPVPATVTLRPIVATLDEDGDLTVNGVKGVWLVASDDPVVTTDFTYTAVFDLTLDGRSVPLPAREFEALVGQIYDLSSESYS